LKSAGPNVPEGGPGPEILMEMNNYKTKFLVI
jgi:hypothetical protein